MVTSTEVIQATLAPIFLVSGAAIFLNFTQARLFRVVDRLRAIGAELRNPTGALSREDAMWQRGRHLRRAILLRNAILFGVLVIAFTVVTTLLLLVPSVWPERDTGAAPIFTFGFGLLSFAIALVLVVTDAFLSVASARVDSREFGPGAAPAALPPDREA